MQNREDLIQTNLEPAVLEASENQIQEIEENKEKLIKTRDRLEIVRTNKILLPKLGQFLNSFVSNKKQKKNRRLTYLCVVGQENATNDETNSIVSGMSMASSTASGMSSYSTGNLLQ